MSTEKPVLNTRPHNREDTRSAVHASMENDIHLGFSEADMVS